MAALAPLKGVVLAGGRSTRMGRDKAGLILRGRTLLDLSVTRLKPFCCEVKVAIAPDQRDDPLRSRFSCLVDEAADGGPMAGLLAAQSHDPDAAWWLLAVDMPSLTTETLSRLTRARSPDHPACALSGPNGVEPLCAIYEPQSHAPLRAAFAAGHRSLRRWLQETRARLVDAPPAETASLNRAADWKRLHK